MVAILVASLFLAAIPEISVEVPAKVTVEIDPSTAYEGSLISGTISIIREQRQKVEASSFILNGAPLAAELIEEVKPASGHLFAGNEGASLLVSKYRFHLPAQPKGLYVFPSVQVKVGTSVVTSVPITYAVEGVREGRELRLEAGILETGPLYPGQSIHVQYRIFFEKPIALTREDLALFHFEGFRNIGAPKIETSPNAGQTVQLITQEVASLKAGTFQSGPSVIEGFVFTRDADGNMQYLPPPLRALADPVRVTIVPFPDKGRPRTFAGSIGLFSYSSKIIGPTTVRAGEKLDLEIAIWGRGDLESVTLGDLSLQKGLREAFVLPDTSPPGQIDDSRKVFHLELRPRSNEVKEIPQMEFSSFDPLTARYFQFTLPAIPIKVYSESGFAASSGGKAVTPIDIQSVLPLTAAQIEAPSLNGSLVGIIIILLVAGLAAQYILKRIITTRRAKVRQESSRKLFLRAIREKSSGDTVLSLIERALLLGLYETGETKELLAHPEELFRTGIQGDIRKFLEGVNARRFGPPMVSKEIDEYIEEASHLYYRLAGTRSARSLILPFFILSLFSLTAPLSAAEFQDDGYTKYLEGESAKTPALRKKAFNEALSFYLYHESPQSSGRLYYNIANCYYQLGEYGFSILYYFRASKLEPRDPLTAQNLAMALQKTGQDPRKILSSSRIFFLHKFFSFYEKELLLLAFLGGFFVFFSLFLWLPFRIFRTLALFLLFCGALTTVSLVGEAYFSPPEAIVIHSSIAASGPGTYYTRIENEPLIAGQKLEVIGQALDGNWIKVKLPSGQAGFLSCLDARVI
jgi:tetratricopeptide (TPR) repeat protein